MSPPSRTSPHQEHAHPETSRSGFVLTTPSQPLFSAPPSLRSATRRPKSKQDPAQPLQDHAYADDARRRWETTKTRFKPASRCSIGRQDRGGSLKTHTQVLAACEIGSMPTPPLDRPKTQDPVQDSSQYQYLFPPSQALPKTQDLMGLLNGGLLQVQDDEMMQDPAQDVQLNDA
ncbi:hypothetical protein C8R44DRAFT_857308 [Mycena epipterygia]|nr:hypothetical protein C8R44DRAFT_857308 [Mycena epipterygia]